MKMLTWVGDLTWFNISPMKSSIYLSPSPLVKVGDERVEDVLRKNGRLSLCGASLSGVFRHFHQRPLTTSCAVFDLFVWNKIEGDVSEWDAPF